MTAVAAVAVAGVVVVGGDRAHPAGEVRMGSGSAWLASSTVGQLTLLDGSSAEVAAQVQVAAAGNVLEVAQQGSTAYAIDQTAGTLRRVDGATYDMTPTQSPIPDAKAGLTAIPGRDALYTLDTRRGILASTDPLTLARRGELLSLASQLSSGTATVDDEGTLWAMDNATGDLVRVAGGSRSVRRGVAAPGRSVLAMAGGRPVIVDQAGRAAMVLDRDTGQVRDTLDVDLRPEDTVAVSGSARAQRLYLVVSRGVLVVCKLDGGDCGTVIPLSAGRFGAAVEAEDRVFVPNYTTGQVWVIDVNQSRVIAKASVLSPDTPFQLIARDGVVFYNDTKSERAGVVRLDGTVVPVAKYDPGNPAKGVTSPRSKPGDPPVGSGDPPADSTEPPADPGGPPRDSDEPPRDSDEPPADADEPPADPDRPPGDSGGPPGNPDDPPEPVLRIDMTETRPTVDQVVTLQVENITGDQPVAARWSFGDGAQGDGVITSHKWTAPRDSYLVAVIATLPDGSERTTSVNVTVTETPTFTLTVDNPNGGTISGDGIDCPQTCRVAVEPDTRITLTAEPDPTHTVGTWAGACAGQSGNTCDITMDADKAASHRFDPVVQTATLRVTLDSEERSNGMVEIRSGGATVLCLPTCDFTVERGEVVELSAISNQERLFAGWSGACAGDVVTCRLEMNKDEAVTAKFLKRVTETRPTISGLRCIADDTFECTVEHTGQSGTQVRWEVNGRVSGDVDDDNVLREPCEADERINVTVGVSNSAGGDTRSDSTVCLR